MTTICAIGIEEVLSAGWDLRKAPGQKWARALYDALHSQYRMIAFTQADPELVRWWMRRESLHDWAAMLTQEAYLDYPEWKVRQVEDFLAEGWEVGLVLDIDNYVLDGVCAMGVLTMQVAVPQHPPGWKVRDEAGPRPWVEVVGDLGDYAPKSAS
jgi:hypothetical protein